MAFWDYVLVLRDFVSWTIMFDILGIVLIVGLVFFVYRVFTYTNHNKHGIARSS